MKFIKRTFVKDKFNEFSESELKRREEDIPAFKDIAGFKDKVGVSPVECDDGEFNFVHENKKPIPASIEYLFDKVVSKEDKKTPEVLIKSSIKKEVPDLETILFEQSLAGSEEDEVVKKQKKSREEIDIDKVILEAKDEPQDFIKAPLADEESVAELEKKHMEFYSILAKIQETHSASDFKSAYDIQDRISYLLNHKTLLYKSLVKELLTYVDSIIKKLMKYHVDIAEKQKKFNMYNKKASELKQYKFKTDESIRIMNENQELAHKELEIQTKNAKEAS